jgi:hypothetical protein
MKEDSLYPLSCQRVALARVGPNESVLNNAMLLPLIYLVPTSNTVISAKRRRSLRAALIMSPTMKTPTPKPSSSVPLKMGER